MYKKPSYQKVSEKQIGYEKSRAIENIALQI